ncbi:MAG: HIT family protein [Candidatus Doudnabacteria bacterium CG10_big_fil_rev_8_21_14_0_10_41_10]|uniref:HIT family protein n=1 Tax=Candidatus Doudnabacteria bacterium CG10_big_fil_rev_8_21_14_0_10_41_10 TaxID=1974551 RepID=A0A2H0VDG1_9BACT|nr:MAG: HIT family protein [Candidatus Doudnabacteria bacterium CG10_big_fil_rev_8_21_14_0_10_41_10]
MQCIFCKIVKGEIPSYKVFEDDKCLAFLDINPIRPGHALLIPKDHHTDLLDTPDEILGHLIKIGKKVSKVVMDATLSEAFNFTTNNGEASGQDIFHLHFHIIPRSSSKELSSWPHRKYKEGEAEQILEKIKAKF